MMTPTKFASLACPQTLAAALEPSQQHIDEVAFQTARLEARIASMAHMSNDDIEAQIAEIVARRSAPLYCIANSLADQDRDWNLLDQLRCELSRRLMIQIAADNAAIDAGLALVAVIHADTAAMREIDEASLVEAVARALEVEAA